MPYDNPFATMRRPRTPGVGTANPFQSFIGGSQMPGSNTPSATTQPTMPSTYAAPGHQGNNAAPSAYSPGYKGSGKGYEKSVLNQQQQYDQMLRNLTGNIAYRANADPYSNLVQEHAGEFQGVHDQFDQARGSLYQSLASRGLLNSSALGTGLGTLYGQEGRGISSLSQGLHQEGRETQSRYEQMLNAILGQRRSEALSTATNRASRRFQAEQAAKAQQAAFWNSIISGAGNVAGSAAAGK